MPIIRHGWLIIIFVTAAMIFGAEWHAVQAQNSVSPKKSNKIDPVLKAPPKGSPVNVVANHLTYDSNSKIATATGKVYMTYGLYVLEATKVVYNLKNDRMTANGNVVMREPSGNIMHANIVELQNRFRDGFARHLRLLLTNDSRITADYAKRVDGSKTIYDRVGYTACNDCVNKDGVPAWEIKSKRITHDEIKHTITHEDATFEFFGVPMLYLPYFEHADPSVKRKSGFLMPSIATSSALGVGIETPYFINLAPNYDLTLRPMFTTKQGPLSRAVWRHRLAKGQYRIDASGLYQLDKSLKSPGDRRWRGSARSIGKFYINEDWNWGWDGSITSDDTYMRRYKIDDRTQIDNRLFVTGLRDRNYFTLEAQHFRGLRDDDDNDNYPYVLPYMKYDFMFDTPVFGGEVGMSSSIYSLYRDQAFTPYRTVHQGTRQTRFVNDLKWRRRMVSPMGAVITPFAKIRSELTSNNNLPDPARSAKRDREVTARILPSGGLDMRLPFVRSDELGQHVVTPVVQVISSTNERKRDRIGNEDAINLNFSTTSLFLQDKFTGSDRFEGGTRANVGLLYHWMMNNGGFARFSVGESFHLAGKNSFTDGSGLDHTTSDFVTAVAFQPNDNWTFTYEARFDHKSFKPRDQEVGLAFEYKRLTTALNYVKIAKAEAYGRDQRMEQIWGTADYRLNKHWSVFGGYRYDFAGNNGVKRVVGIGYDCDCLSFKLSYTQDKSHDRDAKINHAVALSVDLRTLGSSNVGF